MTLEHVPDLVREHSPPQRRLVALAGAQEDVAPEREGPSVDLAREVAVTVDSNIAEIATRPRLVVAAETGRQRGTAPERVADLRADGGRDRAR